MSKNRFLNFALAGLLGMATAVPIQTHADDTEVYTGGSTIEGVRPNILIILDTSGSMSAFDGQSTDRLDRMKDAVSTLILAVFVASLVGSLHCAGMCGGIVVLCVGGESVERTREREWLRHVAYNLGRLAAYATLGVISGAVVGAVAALLPALGGVLLC